MLTCTNCGASVREGARFCTSCGTRLNDPVSAEATGVWATPVTGDSGSSSATATTLESGSDDGEASAATATADPETESNTNSEPQLDEPAGSDADEAAEPAARIDEGFTWSWGASANSERDGTSDTPPQVDEESGMVLEEAGPDETEPETGEMVDATEIDILEPAEPGVDGDESDEPAPETSDTMLVVEEEAASEQGESETLAAWAGQWDSQDAEGEMATSNDDLSDVTSGEPDAPNEPAATSASAPDEAAPNDEEDTVAKAERLIGELRSIIPTLARPMPAPAASLPDPSPLADELEGAARAGQFEDLRETLQSAREHPRDVDTMLSLSSQVDRLLELLDDRDNLARTAESAATRLRPTVDPTEM